MLLVVGVGTEGWAQELSANPFGLESTSNRFSEVGSAEGRVHEFTTRDGRVVRGVVVVENESFVTMEVDKDSRGEVPRGERMVLFRREIRETK